MTGKQWLTIDDWKECIVPLAPIEIRHNMRIEASPPDVTQIVFVSPRVGGEVLGPEPAITSTRESAQFAMTPSLLVLLLHCEALEDNESLFVENCLQMARILSTNQKTIFEILENPRLVNYGCMDAENYTHIVVDQFEEDNFLRELNKCLLTFHPTLNEFATAQDFMQDRRCRKTTIDTLPSTNNKRLSPIGERSTPHSQVWVDGASTSTPRSSIDTDSELVIEQRPSWLSVKPRHVQVATGPGKFIILGSSGECLPVNRRSQARSVSLDRYSSCDTSSESSEEFHSAKGSVDEPPPDDGNDADEEDVSFAEKYLSKLYSPERRYDFARRLREALHEPDGSERTDSTDDSYEAGAISVKGPDVFDADRIRIRRRNSGGFVLQEDSSFDEDVMQEMILRGGGDNDRKSRGNSSKYSFSTDMSSELSELNISSEELELLPEDLRNKAVFHYATSILKRGFSESVMGCGEFPTNENDNNFMCDVNNNSSTNGHNSEQFHEAGHQQHTQQNSHNNNISARSQSMEVVKQKHLLAAKLVRRSELFVQFSAF